MKKGILMLAALLIAYIANAGTPAEALVEEYKNMKGARNLVAKGIIMKMARPMLKDYSIAPLAPKVEELSVLRMDKAEEAVIQRFLADMQEAVSTYIYSGKSDTKNGVVDTYVHLSSPDMADELIVFNSEICAFYSLKGKFPVKELLEIQKPVQ